MLKGDVHRQENGFVRDEAAIPDRAAEAAAGLGGRPSPASPRGRSRTRRGCIGGLLHASSSDL